MQKMTKEDVESIVKIIKAWKGSPIRWNAIREVISKTILKGKEPWSRQSLQANDAINQAWQATRSRLTVPPTRTNHSDAVNLKYAELKAAHALLEAKYENLALRHRQLIYNASMLPGGTRLLLDPLPDNTPAQKTGVGSARSRHK